MGILPTFAPEFRRFVHHFAITIDARPGNRLKDSPDVSSLWKRKMESSQRNGSEGSNPIQQFTDGLLEKHRSMTASQKIVCWAILAVVIVVGVWAAYTSGGDETIHLYGGRQFTQPELAAMENAFSSAGLNESKIEGLRIVVPAKSKAEYLAALDKAHIDFADPYSFAKWAAESSNPFLSSGQRRQQEQLAEEQELALIVRSMRDIQQATVQLDEEKTGFPPTTEKTALVAVETASERELTSQRIQAIRDSIAASVAGLDREHVTIANLKTGRSWTGLADADLNSSYAMRKSEYENYWRDKISRLLGAVHGAQVEVNIAMEPAAANSESDATAAAFAWAPSRVTAAIDVPQSYFHKVWKFRNQEEKKPPTPQAIATIEQATHAKIKEVVGQLLQSSGKEASAANVIVTTWDDVPSTRIEEPTLAVAARRWASENPGLVLVISLTVLGVILVRVLLGSTKQTRPSEPAAEAASHQPVEDSQAALNLQSQLAAMVSENPEAAAEKLNEWFRDAA